MTKLVLVDAGPEGRVVWELDITDFYGNSNGMLAQSSPAWPGLGWLFPDGHSLVQRSQVRDYESSRRTDRETSVDIGVMHGGAASVIFGVFALPSHPAPAPFRLSMASDCVDIVSMSHPSRCRCPYTDDL